MSDPSLFQGATAEQQAAATLQGAVLVLAGAGTGKTRTLTLGVAHRIRERGILPSRILAVTFTNKAAAEMASRIRTALGGEGVPHWMGTFHGLGARQLRAEPEAAGLRSGFDILDADDSRRIVKRVMKAMDPHALATTRRALGKRPAQGHVRPAVPAQGQSWSRQRRRLPTSRR